MNRVGTIQMLTVLALLCACTSASKSPQKTSTPPDATAPKEPKMEDETFPLEEGKPVVTKWGPTFSMELVSHKHGVGFTAGDYRITAKGAQGEESFEFRVTKDRDWFGEKKVLGRVVRVAGRDEQWRARIELPAKLEPSALDEEALFEKVKSDPRVVAELEAHGGLGRTAGRLQDWGAYDFSYGAAKDGDVVARVGIISGAVLDVSFEKTERQMKKKPPAPER